MLYLSVAVRLPFLLAGCRSVTVSSWLSLYECGMLWMKNFLKLLICNENLSFVESGWMPLDGFSIGYEPRGSGFNSCQPHQTNNPEAEMLQGFFVLF
jgi:hypothetical protein